MHEDEDGTIHRSIYIEGLGEEVKSPSEYFDVDAISPENFDESRSKSQIIVENFDDVK